MEYKRAGYWSLDYIITSGIQPWQQHSDKFIVMKVLNTNEQLELWEQFEIYQQSKWWEHLLTSHNLASWPPSVALLSTNIPLLLFSLSFELVYMVFCCLLLLYYIVMKNYQIINEITENTSQDSSVWITVCSLLHNVSCTYNKILVYLVYRFNFINFIQKLTFARKELYAYNISRLSYVNSWIYNTCN